jgi:hypothetical protein
LRFRNINNTAFPYFNKRTLINMAETIYYFVECDAHIFITPEDEKQSNLDPGWMDDVISSGTAAQCCKLANDRKYEEIITIVCDNNGLIQWHWCHGVGWWYPALSRDIPLGARLSEIFWHVRLLCRATRVFMEQQREYREYYRE